MDTSDPFRVKLAMTIDGDPTGPGAPESFADDLITGLKEMIDDAIWVHQHPDEYPDHPGLFTKGYAYAVKESA